MNPLIKAMYKRLANFLVGNINFHEVSIILEVGCGSGQLTIPFAKNVKEILKQFKLIALDVSAGLTRETWKR
ncbi:MAG: class I SAM-dependent methyltransferase [Candidatus Bathyarchaeota archaeon]|nr:class I SAM-dependent methyltransferase [Candidatus Bathyarchaeota archaeon]